MVLRQPTTKVEHWDNNTNIIFNKHLESGDIYCTKDLQAFDNFNCKYFGCYCNFISHGRIYQAHKHLHDKLCCYKQGVDLDKDRPVFRNDTPVRTLHLLLRLLYHFHDVQILLLLYCPLTVIWQETYKYSPWQSRLTPRKSSCLGCAPSPSGE